MAQAVKATSRWNSFLAGVESRLDTILTDEDVKKEAASAVESSAEEAASSPSVSGTSAVQPRLSERLAKAVAEPRTPPVLEAASAADSGNDPEPLETVVNKHEGSGSKEDEPARSSNEGPREYRSTETGSDDAEDVQVYLERIEALQAKVQYLVTEATSRAKAAKSETKPVSNEHKLAVKDEKVALLIEEGQVLAQKEMKHLTLIKKLRLKSAEDEQQLKEIRQTLSQTTIQRNNAQATIKQLETANGLLNRQISTTAELQTKLDAAEALLSNRDSLIHDLQTRLADSQSSSPRPLTSDDSDGKLAKLSDQLAKLQAEKDDLDKEYTHQARTFDEARQHHTNRERVLREEREAERHGLERRLEAYKVQVEQVSAGPQNDAQAALLRQVETLQNQYSIASDNWHGIESTLLSRINTIETERNEVTERENDIRRRMRDVVSHENSVRNRNSYKQEHKAKAMDSEFEQIESHNRQLEHDLQVALSQASRTQERSHRMETELKNTVRELREEAVLVENRFQRRLEEERGRWMEERPKSSPDNLYATLKYGSSTPHTRKSSIAAGRSTSRNRQNAKDGGFRGVSSRYDRPFISNRSSSAHLDSLTPTQLQDIRGSVDLLDGRLGGGEGSKSEDPFPENEEFSCPRTPPTERSVHDLVSVATVGPGPSVQLIERLSTTVRKLEADKAAHREDLARYMQQRDEARQQIVDLMRDDDRASAKKAQGLTEELQAVKKRYETTLEMYGEQSERVEELQQDVLDLKAMMRSMVEEKVS